MSDDPPTSAEPVGWIRNGTFVRNPAAFVIGPQTLDWEIPLFAHPPTSEWNDAIEAADVILVTELGNRTSGPRVVPNEVTAVWAALTSVLAAIRGLKR